MIKSLDKLRKVADKCTQMAGVEDKFETVWITKSAFLKDLDAIEHEVEERYIEGPKDKNGEPIFLGDVLQGERVGGGWCEPFEVYQLRFGPDGWDAIEKCGIGHMVRLCRHYHAPTVEDVLDEFASAYDRIGGEDEEHQKYLNLIADFAAKLRLVNDEE